MPPCNARHVDETRNVTALEGNGLVIASPGEAAGRAASHNSAAAAAVPNRKGGLLQEFVTSGVSVACATIVTNPLDVIKTRMQLRQAQAGPGPGLVSTGRGIVQAEGAGALWKGLTPAVLRGLLYGGLRLGLYSPTKLWLEQQASQLNSGGSSNSSSSSGGFQASGGSGTSGGSSSSKSVAASSSSTSTKLLAGTLSGGVAAVVCSPTELVKVRLQAVNSPHKSAWAAVEAVVASDGVAGLWKGATPGLVRASVLTASQCATYDETKRWVMSTTGWGDTTITHLACSLVTGLASTTATNPVDVVKTHMFMGGSKFSGPLQCTAHLYRAHGAAGFMRGWWANYSRLGPQTCVTFVVAEQLRRLAGLQAL